jgi:uncharacterized protein
VKTFQPVRRPAALAATILITVTALAACTDQHNTFTETRSITVTGEGEASGAPDQASVSAGVQILAETVIEATRENESIIGKIMEALDEQNYQEPGQNRISGYRVSNVVTVKIDDIDKVGDVLAAVINAGANSIHGIQFGVKDTKALEQQAREAAMADARARAESLARLAGVQLGEVLSISTSYGAGPPRPMMSRSYDMAEAAAPSISPGQQDLSVQIHATFAIR